MKKIIFSLLGVAFLFGACEDRLNIGQKGVISVEDFYKTDDDAQNALNNLYQSFVVNIAGNEGIYVALPVLFNEPGDDMLAAGNWYGDNDFGAELNEFRYDSNNEVIRNAYWGLYAVIYDANLVLDNTVPDTDVKKRVYAEARTLRAWAHLMLAIGWNSPPLVDHVLAADEKPGNHEGGHDGLLEWCATEAEAAVADLDERTSPADQVGASKATKGFALAVAGKARLFKGDYAGAKTNLKQIINSQKYELVPAERWADLFHVAGDLNEEMIFQANFVENTAITEVWITGYNSHSSWMWINFWNWRTDALASKPSLQGPEGWGGHAIRKDFAERMLANDGDSPRRKATFLTVDEFLYEMPWNGTAGQNLTREQLETSDKIGIARIKTTDTVTGKVSGGLYGIDGYYATKFIPRADDLGNQGYSYKNLTIFRYAEVLLMYAEACAQTNDPDGLQYLQAIQQRAGSAHISTALTLDEVKNEKSYEMWLEGVRFPDMVRWGDTDGVVNNGKNIPTSYDAFFTSGEAKHRIYVEYSDPNAGATGFVKGKHEYFAFPYAATSINPNLRQNPSGLSQNSGGE